MPSFAMIVCTDPGVKRHRRARYAARVKLSETTKMNCLFDSLIATSPPEKRKRMESARALRKKLISHIVAHSHMYRAHIESDSGETIAQYAQRMADEREMGDYTMIVSFCRVFELSVLIVFKLTRKIHIVDIVPDAPVVSIMYTPGHYEPIFGDARVLTRPVYPPDRFKASSLVK